MASKATASAPVTLPEDVHARIALDVDGGKQGVELGRRVFSSGSQGFTGAIKVQGADGRRYQVNVNVVLIGSKPVAAA
jgi:hypothetical protein